jgi:SAM-dependent methyltransferase
MDVSGLDYTELGCRQTERIFERDGIDDGHIYLADAFSPPEELLGRFDYVISLGVAEHFDDTADALKAFSRFVKPGGILITSVPNLAGVTGWLQRLMNKPVMDIHVPMDRNYLYRMVKLAGLGTVRTQYFVSVSFAVTLEGLHGETIPYYGIKKFILKSMRYASKVLWMLEEATGRSLPEGRLLSAGIISAAQKAGGPPPNKKAPII